jgi:hypothetical protein
VTEPEVGLLADLPLAGPPGFITVSNIRTAPTSNSFTVTFDTDQACLMAMDWWSHNDPSITTGTAVLEGVLRTNHIIASGAFPAGDHTGKMFGFSLRLDANDVTGKLLRAQQGFVQLLGARSVAKANAVPVRFNGFSGPMTAAVPALGTQGNWSRYTWSQWNPKSIA